MQEPVSLGRRGGGGAMSKLSGDTLREGISALLEGAETKKRNFTQTIELQVSHRPAGGSQDRPAICGGLGVPGLDAPCGSSGLPRMRPGQTKCAPIAPRASLAASGRLGYRAGLRSAAFCAVVWQSGSPALQDFAAAEC